MLRLAFGRLAAAITALALLGGQPPAVVAAETYALGTTSPGSFPYTLAAALAGVCNKDSDLLRVQPFGTFEQILPLVDSGELSFALTNVVEVDAIMKAGAVSAEHLRAVAFLFPFQIGLVVRADSGAVSVADLKGKRVPEFTTQASFQGNLKALLANGGLSDEDVERVPLANFVKEYDAMSQGQLDVILAPPGQPALADVSQRVGELRFLPIDDSPASMAAMRAISPLVYATEVKPNPNFIGID